MTMGGGRGAILCSVVWGVTMAWVSNTWSSSSAVALCSYPKVRGYPYRFPFGAISGILRIDSSQSQSKALWGLTSGLKELELTVKGYRRSVHPKSPCQKVCD